MVLLDWLFNNWYWGLAAYVAAFGAYVGAYVYGACRAERAKSRTNRDSHGDVRANLARAVNREPRRRSVECAGYWGRSGRHAVDVDPVRADAQAVA